MSRVVLISTLNIRHDCCYIDAMFGVIFFILIYCLTKCLVSFSSAQSYTDAIFEVNGIFPVLNTLHSLFNVLAGAKLYWCDICGKPCLFP